MCCEIGTDRDARSVQDGARSVQDGATRSVRCGATRLVRCGATISVQMVRDPCEMVRDWCQMLRDRYEILRQWHEMVRDSTRCCKISTSLRDGVRSVRGGAALRSVRDGAFLLSPSLLPILLPAPSFSSSQLLPPSPPLLLLHTVSIPAACWGSRICTCTPRHSTQQHTHKQHARHTCHTRSTYLPKLLSRGSPGGPPHVLAVPLCAVLPGHKARAPAFHLQMTH